LRLGNFGEYWVTVLSTRYWAIADDLTILISSEWGIFKHSDNDVQARYARIVVKHLIEFPPSNQVNNFKKIQKYFTIGRSFKEMWSNNLVNIPIHTWRFHRCYIRSLNQWVDWCVPVVVHRGQWVVPVEIASAVECSFITKTNKQTRKNMDLDLTHSGPICKNWLSTYDLH